LINHDFNFFGRRTTSFRVRIRQGIDLVYADSAAGLGLSLVLIHIYVTPIKRFLQALWVVGVMGSVGTYLVVAQPLDEGLVQYMLENPTALWFVGPTFAALTGLVFKEGTQLSSMCLSMVEMQNLSSS
jgi:uncharacterized integral membrane protein